MNHYCLRLGACLIAACLATEAGDLSVEVEKQGRVRVVPVGEAIRVNSNRRYLLELPAQVPAGDYQFTQHSHDRTSGFTVTANSDGPIYLCLINCNPASLGLKGEWEPVGKSVSPGPRDATATFYESRVKQGDQLKVKSDPEWGAIVIAGKIELVQGVGETLYNGIQLAKGWPPEYDRDPRQAMPIPYLENPPAVIPIDVGRQLFVDDFLIEETTLTREFHRPEYHEANPVLKPDRPWENKSVGWFAAPFSGGAWYDPADELFKMWYTGGYLYSLCYATSKDGINWEKPNLDVYPDSNVVLNPRPDARKRSVDTITVWLDYDAKDPAERFKYFATENVGRFAMVYRTSPDGIHWTEPLAIQKGVKDRSTAFYNPFRKRWVFSARSKWEGRARTYRDDKDPGDLLSGGEFTRWAAGEDADPRHVDPKCQHIHPQLYNLDVAPYESLMLGQFCVWQGPDNGDCGKVGLQKRCDILLGFSRDGFHFSRPDRRRFISCTWDEKSWRYGNVQSVNGGPLVVGDELYFYFSGRAKPAGGFYDTDKMKALSEGWDADAATGLAILRRDGFASMNAGGRAGTLTTRPVSFTGKQLFVNVDCPRGELKAEVLDRSGAVIEPFTLQNSEGIMADGTLVPLSWKGSHISELAGRPVRFRFRLASGKLYSFWVSPDASGSSRGYVGAGGPGFTGPVDTVGRASLTGE